MTNTTQFPSQDEIDAFIREAQQMRADTIAMWLKAGFTWLTHPHFGHRTA
jgi:hypothetical protein